MSENDNADGIFYVDFPVQVVSENEEESFVYHNILLKKLPDGTFIFEPNEVQLFVEDESISEKTDNTTSVEYTLADYSSDSIQLPGQEVQTTNIGENSVTTNVIETSDEARNKSVPDDTPENSTNVQDKILPAKDGSKSSHRIHNFVEGKPGVRYYQNKSLPEHKGPGRPRKDGTVKPRAERKGPFFCTSCNMEFETYSLLRKHERNHLEERAHQCSVCFASFNLMSNYRLHMAMHESGAHRCPECHKKFNRLASLCAHLMLHCVDDNPVCPNCAVTFNTQALLNQHLKSCTEDKLHDKLKSPEYRASSSPTKTPSRKQKRSSMRLSCNTCSKVFSKPSQLERHIRIHTGEKPYKCYICDRAFSQKGSLTIHRVKHTGSRPFSCPFCPATFTQKGNLQAHRLRVHRYSLGSNKERAPNTDIDGSDPTSKQNFPCQKCSCVFKRLGSLNSHMNKLHPANIPTVPANNTLNDINSVMSQLAELRSVTMDKDILQQAVNNSVMDKKIPDSPPSHSSTDKLKSTDQQVSHSSVNNITVFDNSFGDSMRCYVVKQRKVAGIKWRQCNFCTREFKKPSDLIRHLRIHTKEKPFKCAQCSRRFTVKSTLTAHLKTHVGQKSHACPICQKTFSSSSSLNVHARLHTGVKPFKCQICEKTFRTSGMLQTHRVSRCGKNVVQTSPINNKEDNQVIAQLEEPIIITKTGLVQSESKLTDVYGGVSAARPFACEYCTAAFMKSSHLKQHLSIHSKERPFKCSDCDECFNNNNSLKSHMQTHSEVRPYKCTISNCGALYSTPSSLKHHSKRHGEQKNYMCPYCQKTFKIKFNCRKHMKIHKNELNNQFKESVIASKENNVPSLNTLETITDITTIPEGTQFLIASNTENSTNLINSTTSDLIQTLSDNSNQNNDVLISNLNNENGIIIPNINLMDTSQNISYITLPKYQLLNKGDIILDPKLINVQNLNENDLSGIKILQNDVRVMDNVVLQENIVSDRNVAQNINAYSLVNGNFVIGNLGNQRNVFTLLTNNEHQSLLLAPNILNHNQINLQIDDSQNLYEVTNDISTETNLTSIIENNAQFATADNCNNVIISNMQYTNNEVLDSNLTVENSEILPQSTLSTINLTTQGSMNKYVLNLRNENCVNLDNQNSVLNILGDKLQQKEIHIEIQREFSTEENLECMDDKSGIIVRLNKTLNSENIDTNSEQKLPGDDKCLQLDFSYDTDETADSEFENYESAGIKVEVLDESSTSAVRNTTSDNNLDSGDQTQDQIYEEAGLTIPQIAEDGKEAYLEILHHENTEDNHECGDEICSDSEKSIRGKSKSISLSQQEFLDYVYKQSNTNNKTNTVEHPNKCHLCVKSFKKPSDLTRHIRTHTGERPYSCSICHRAFSLKTSLDSHAQTHDKTASKSIVCNVCGSRFSTKGSLKVHMRLHTGFRPFECPLCDMSFRTSGHKKAHLLVHYRGSFKDGKDPKDVITKGNKISHMMGTLINNINDELSKKPDDEIQSTQHINNLKSGCVENKSIIYDDSEHLPNSLLEKDKVLFDCSFDTSILEPELNSMSSEIYVETTTDYTVPQKKKVNRKVNKQHCSTCGKSFMKPSQLNRHKLIHTGEKPYQCNLCTKAFNQKNALITHMRHHTGLRPHECPYCAKSFTQKSNLKTHILRTHDLVSTSLQTQDKNQTLSNMEEDILHNVDAISTSYQLQKNQP